MTEKFVKCVDSTWAEHGLTKDKIYKVLKEDNEEIIVIDDRGSVSGWDIHRFEFSEQSKLHTHYNMIVEWAKDPSREVQYKQGGTTLWIDNELQSPAWYPDCQYRFEDTAPVERVFPVTSISGSELEKIFINTSNKDNADFKAVANAAIKQYILDTEAKEIK